MHLKGIYAPIVTPFNADESINYPVLEQLIEYLIANKIAGLVPGGTTGEVYASAIPVMNWSVEVIFLKTGKISAKVGKLA